jgi:hypothetical protein
MRHFGPGLAPLLRAGYLTCDSDDDGGGGGGTWPTWRVAPFMARSQGARLLPLGPRWPIYSAMRGSPCWACDSGSIALVMNRPGSNVKNTWLDNIKKCSTHSENSCFLYLVSLRMRIIDADDWFGWFFQLGGSCPRGNLGHINSWDDDGGCVTWTKTPWHLHGLLLICGSSISWWIREEMWIA